MTETPASAVDRTSDAQHQKAEADYMSEVDLRLRQATWQVRVRVGAIQLSWVVVTVAGAAIAVADTMGWGVRVSAMLGFVVVVFQGFEKIFGRTTEGSRSLDVLRRDLGREKRLYLTGEGKYKGVDDPFSMFVDSAEQLIERNDEEEVAYNAQLTGRP